MLNDKIYLLRITNTATKLATKTKTPPTVPAVAATRMSTCLSSLDSSGLVIFNDIQTVKETLLSSIKVNMKNEDRRRKSFHLNKIKNKQQQ